MLSGEEGTPARTESHGAYAGGGEEEGVNDGKPEQNDGKGCMG